MSEDSRENEAGPGSDIIDWDTFNQILEMDEGDDGDRDFSKGIVYGFFEQAEQTFQMMEDALDKCELSNLSSLGHFLKGSSAALGLTKVKNTCEKIQHLGARKDETGSTEIDDYNESIRQITAILPILREEYSQAEKFLKDFFGDEEDA
jgi:osomolarity two-component system phosphorelay intermediate protein YPD1